jgi:molybdopterin molybdotransferase
MALSPVGLERVSLSQAAGRVLAEPIRADRPSPACDTSAMDGYAVRMSDLRPAWLPVLGEAAIGRPPPAMPSAAVLSIFTGGPVPHGCDAVVPREHTIEADGAMRLREGATVRPGQHIRRRGENGLAGRVVAEAGRVIDAPIAAAMAAVGVSGPSVYRRVRVAAIVTGDEVLAADAAAQPWQVRDSNGAALAAMLGTVPWVRWLGVTHADDNPAAIRAAVAAALESADAVLLTGGVSVGDHDHVPAAVVACGCRIMFHGLPIRPGKPVLAAIGPSGQAVVGLPGNPVAVLTTAKLVALPLLRALSGQRSGDGTAGLADVEGDAVAPADLWWYPPVRRLPSGRYVVAAGKGSGDWIAAAQSDGFIEVPPGEPAAGRRALCRWSV